MSSLWVVIGIGSSTLIQVSGSSISTCSVSSCELSVGGGSCLVGEEESCSNGRVSGEEESCSNGRVSSWEPHSSTVSKNDASFFYVLSVMGIR